MIEKRSHIEDADWSWFIGRISYSLSAPCLEWKFPELCPGPSYSDFSFNLPRSEKSSQVANALWPTGKHATHRVPCSMQYDKVLLIVTALWPSQVYNHSLLRNQKQRTKFENIQLLKKKKTPNNNNKTKQNETFLEFLCR